MSNTTMTPRRAIGLLRGTLLQHLSDLQDRIIKVERFGAEVVAHPEIQQRLGPIETLEEMLERHAQLVAEFNELTRISDRASEEELRAFVRSRREP